MYDDSALPDLPPGTDPKIGTFTVTPTPKEGATPTVRVNFMHDINGVIKVTSAQMMEEVAEDPKEPAADATAKEGEGKDAAEGKEPAEGEGKDAPAEEPPRKKRFRKVPLNVTSSVTGMTKASVEMYQDMEQKMSKQDLLIEATNNARNDVESYIYAMRDKVIGDLRPFCTDDEKSAFEASLQEAEDWLYYGDGYDAIKDVYEDKLATLKKMGSPIERRHIESTTRQGVIDSLKKGIADYKAWVSSTDDKFAHISDTERDIVRKACAESESWLYDQMEQQGKLPSNVDPVLTSNVVSQHHRELVDKCRPIQNKPKPAPKPKEEKKEPEAKAPEPDATADAKEGETFDADAPPPPATDEGKEGDAAAAPGDAPVSDPMETDEGSK